jgi:CheY-like chemotaxis protein
VSSDKPSRILVVDDEPDILWVIRITLRARGGFEVEMCTSGREALDLARSFIPDLILLDVMMPEMDGPTTLQALQRDPQTANIPIVFMTAKVMPQETARYLALGAAGVIAKPFDQRMLAGEIEEILHGRRSTTHETPEAETAALFEAYTAALPGKIGDIQQRWQRIEAEPGGAEAVQALEHLIHRLAGTAETYGYASVSQIAGQIEQAIASAAAGGELTQTAREQIRPLIVALEAAARAPESR